MNEKLTESTNAQIHKFLIRHYKKMCSNKVYLPNVINFLNNFIANTDSLHKEEYEAYMFGLEAWRPQFLKDAMLDQNLWTIELEAKYGKIFKNEDWPYDLSKYGFMDYTSDISPKIFSSWTPRFHKETMQQLNILHHMGFKHHKDFELFNLGEKEILVAEKEEIAKHFFSNAYKIIPDNPKDIKSHDLATYGVFEFILWLYHNGKHIEHALYLESDAIPVYNFKKKYKLLLQQLYNYGSDYDIVVLGTCLNIHIRLIQYKNINISQNLAHHPTTRCFNSVLFHRRAIEKIILAGAIVQNYEDIDHLFNRIIKKLNLKVYNAIQPLFYEGCNIYYI